MAKYSDCAWSDTPCNTSTINNNLSVGATSYLTIGELNLMSRFSSTLNSSLGLSSATDSDATSSSTSSSSATTNNSSNSLSLSPAAADRDIFRSAAIINNNNIKNNNNNNNININREEQIHISNHLLELQKEIKEEEEEIFADINSLINGGSRLYSTLVDDDDGNIVSGSGCGVLDHEGPDLGLNFNEEHFNNIKRNNNSTTPNQRNNFTLFNNKPHNNSNNNIPNLRNYLSQPNSNDEGLFSTNSEDVDLNDYQGHSIDDLDLLDNQRHYHLNDQNEARLDSNDTDEQIPKHQQFQSDRIDHNSVDFLNHEDDDTNYLEEHHHINNEDEIEHANYMQEHAFASCSQVDQQEYQKLQAVIQQVTSNLPKPCVFFLEGNCRRSDCKYSHDLSNITCKYWIEGFCFKGELCPFLHSYIPNGSEHPNILEDEEGLKSLSKKQLNPTFVIESEADFPSLPLDAPVTVLNDSSKSNIESDTITTTIKNQILSSNPAVVFKTLKKKRKRG